MWGGVSGHVGGPWELLVVSVQVIVACFVTFCFHSCFREYRDHTGSPAILVGECGVM